MQPDFFDPSCSFSFIRANQKKGFGSFLYGCGCVANFFDKGFENYAAHPFNKFDAANDKVPAAGNAATGDLIVQFPDHTRDVHMHTL